MAISSPLPLPPLPLYVGRVSVKLSQPDLRVFLCTLLFIPPQNQLLADEIGYSARYCVRYHVEDLLSHCSIQVLALPFLYLVKFSTSCTFNVTGIIVDKI